MRRIVFIMFILSILMLVLPSCSHVSKTEWRAMNKRISKLEAQHALVMQRFELQDTIEANQDKTITSIIELLKGYTKALEGIAGVVKTHHPKTGAVPAFTLAE